MCVCIIVFAVHTVQFADRFSRKGKDVRQFSRFGFPHSLLREPDLSAAFPALLHKQSLFPFLDGLKYVMSFYT